MCDCRMQTVRTKEEKEVLEHFAGVVSTTNTRTSLHTIGSTHIHQPVVVALRYSTPGWYQQRKSWKWAESNYNILSVGHITASAVGTVKIWIHDVGMLFTSETLCVTLAVCNHPNYITWPEADHSPYEWFHWLRLKEEFCKGMCQGYCRLVLTQSAAGTAGTWGWFNLFPSLCGVTKNLWYQIVDLH